MNGRRKKIEEELPQLIGKDYRITSLDTNEYNCIAWAAEKIERWWWPTDEAYWPPEATRNKSLTGFVEAFSKLGYSPCESAVFEPEFQKIAIFCDDEGQPTHAARQLANGKWTSKLGRLEDIEHNLTDLEGSFYGHVKAFLKKKISS